MSVFRRKSVSALRAEADAGGFRRVLGPVGLSALGIGAIIGTTGLLSAVFTNDVV